ncbi:hypothetical protein ACFX13_028067 [Malus domestica]
MLVIVQVVRWWQGRAGDSDASGGFNHGDNNSRVGADDCGERMVVTEIAVLVASWGCSDGADFCRNPISVLEMTPI